MLMLSRQVRGLSKSSQPLEMSQWGATYLVGDPGSKVLDGELWVGHLWLEVQRVVAMVIVTLLEESVVCCLTTKQ